MRLDGYKPKDNDNEFEQNEDRNAAVSIAALAIGAIVLIIGSAHLFKEGMTYHEGKEIYSKVRETAISDEGDSVNIIEEAPLKEEQEDKEGATAYEITRLHKLLKVNFEALSRTNSDTVAWIRFDNAKINYPVLCPPENDVNKYLDTTFTGIKNPAGCIFTDPKQDQGFDNLNTFVYGHNMKDGSMFGTLKELYRHPDKIVDPYIEIYFKDGRIRLYRVFSIYLADGSSKMYSGVNDDSYDEYVASALERTSYDAGNLQALRDHRKILTLSTCYGEDGSDQRLLLHAVQVEYRSGN